MLSTFFHNYTYIIFYLFSSGKTTPFPNSRGFITYKKRLLSITTIFLSHQQTFIIRKQTFSNSCGNEIQEFRKSIACPLLVRPEGA